MKKTFLLVFVLFPLFALAQKSLAGREFRTRTSESCKETLTGGYMVYQYTTIAFTKDSVTFISHLSTSENKEPQVTKSTYTYSTTNGGISVNTPNGSHYFLRDSILISDCKYDSGKEYYEITEG